MSYLLLQDIASKNKLLGIARYSYLASKKNLLLQDIAT